MPPAAYGAVMGGMALYGALHKSPAEKATANLSSTMASLANKQHTMAEPALQKAMQYYMTLASGNRTAIQGAMAPQMSALNASYKGAQKGIDLMGAGPGRDRARAELDRQKVGQLGMMPMMERGNAMKTLLGAGQQGEQNAMGYYQTQASLLPMMNQFEQQRSQSLQGLGSSMFNIFQPYIMGDQKWGNAFKMGGGSSNPSSGSFGLSMPNFNFGGR